MECGKLKYISHMYDNENWYFSNLSCINTLLIQRIFMFMTIHSTFNCYSELATKNSLLISTMTFSLSLCLLLSLYAYTYVHIPSSPFLCTNYIILPCHVSLSLIVSNLLLSICPLYLWFARLPLSIVEEFEQPACEDDSFQCDNGACIPIGWTCDNVKDCSNAEDERVPECISKYSSHLLNNVHNKLHTDLKGLQLTT